MSLLEMKGLPHSFGENQLYKNGGLSLKNALSEFPGTVLLVSHEENFYKGWAQRIINIENI